MSSYIKPGKQLEYDNAPDWLVGYMKYRRAVLVNSPTSIMTFFGAIREFCQWLQVRNQTGSQPRSETDLRAVDILDFPLDMVLSVTQNDIETYMYFLTDTLLNDPATRCKKLVSLRTMYDYFLDQREALGIDIKENPATRVRRPKMPKKQPIFLPEQDQIAFLKAIDGENEERDYALFLLMLSAGLRVSEVVGIDMPDLNLESKMCRIRGKGNKERIIPLTQPTCDAISMYLKKYRDLIPDLRTEALFVSKRCQSSLTARSVEKAMQKYVLKAKMGGKGYTPHKLRHTTGTMLAKDGEDLLVIQNILGHESTDTTKIYTHLGQEDISAAIRRSSLGSLER